MDQCSLYLKNKGYKLTYKHKNTYTPTKSNRSFQDHIRGQQNIKTSYWHIFCFTEYFNDTFKMFIMTGSRLKPTEYLRTFRLRGDWNLSRGRRPPTRTKSRTGSRPSWKFRRATRVFPRNKNLKRRSWPRRNCARWRILMRRRKTAGGEKGSGVGWRRRRREWRRGRRCTTILWRHTTETSWRHKSRRSFRERTQLWWFTEKSRPVRREWRR